MLSHTGPFRRVELGARVATPERLTLTQVPEAVEILDNRPGILLRDNSLEGLARDLETMPTVATMVARVAPNVTKVTKMVIRT